MRLLRTCFASAMAWIGLAPCALACSMSGHYVVPTNFELVDMADAIVVATAVSETAGERGAFNSTVSFRVESALKGQPPAAFDDLGSSLGLPAPSDPHSLDGANPEAYAGACIRTTFAKGKSYVIFMFNDPQDGWRPMGFAFARVNEDYFGPDSLWVRTIETYVEVERKFGPMEQIDELERMLEAKMKEPPSRHRDIEAADIVDHLRSRSPYKPTQYLVETFEQLERGEAPRFPLRPPSADAERSTAQAITDFLFDTKPPDQLSREEEMEFVLYSLLNGDHPDAASLFERLLAKPDASASEVGLGLQFLAGHGQLRRVYDLFETSVMPHLVRSSMPNAMFLIDSMSRAMRGDNYDSPAWKSDAYVAARWPRLAFDLRHFQVLIAGEEAAYDFSEEFEALRPASYRDWPEWTLARARDFDQDVEAWAIAEVSDKAQLDAYAAAVRASRRINSSVESPADPALLPLQALVRAYGEDRNEALLLAFCQGPERRETLFDALGAADPLDNTLVARMLATPTLSEDERDTLVQTVAALHGQQVAMYRRDDESGYLWRGYDWDDLLMKATRGEPINAAPITCTAQ